eukprot:GHVR01061101.1.p1 GENE.GHVR01061101.1~~GHVR01061101.1.p1  ORF type:complete len:234 (-),score=14.23 GHVR01061101.1:159-860(-)
MHDLVTTVDGDPIRLSLSYATTQRYRVGTVQTITEKIKENWSPPSVDNVHWDGKLMDTLDCASKEERLPVLLSGIGAIPHMSTVKTDDLFADATKSCNLIEEWNCENCLAGMVFDTTSSNTGCKTAACITLQTRLNRPLLWYACRHHVGEVVLTHVWNALNIEVSKSSNVGVFQRFKDNFPAINRSITQESKVDLDFPAIPLILLERKGDIIELCESYILILLVEEITINWSN